MRPAGSRVVALVLAGVISGLAGSAVAAPEASARCAGGDTLAPVARRWAAAVQAKLPETRVQVDGATQLAADGFALFLKGEADCVLFVREPFPSEEAAFRARFGREPVLVPVAGGSYATKGGTHAIAVYVNAANPIAGLTLRQLDSLFSAERRRGGPAIETWGDLGLGGAWARRPIHRYGMLTRRDTGNPPGIVNFIQRRVLLGSAFAAGISEEVDRPGEQALAAIVRKVGADPLGIGYSGFGYAQGQARAVPLAEDENGPFVAGSPESVAARRYPLARTLYVMFDRTPGAPNRAVRAFLMEALSASGQAMLNDDPEGFLPLDADRLKAARALVQ